MRLGLRRAGDLLGLQQHHVQQPLHQQHGSTSSSNTSSPCSSNSTSSGWCCLLSHLTVHDHSTICNTRSILTIHLNSKHALASSPRHLLSLSSPCPCPQGLWLPCG